MVFCGVCKETKEVKNRWNINEHSADNNIMRNFKVCDGCAVSLVKRLSEEERDDSAPDKINMVRSSLIKEFYLAEDGNLELTISMDLAKARKLILEETNTKE
ncbi:MAG: hypothetical protein J4432_00715 [DPANN group archaeon]|nr:hypothetical protein [DPANN group archaeon]